MCIFFRERSKKFRETLAANPERKAIFLKAKRDRAKAKYKKQKQDPAFMKRKREQVKLSRWRKTQPTVEDQTQDEAENIGPYKVKATLSKAIKKVSRVLPEDTEKKKIVVKQLYFQHFPIMKPKNKRILPEREVIQLVKDFFLRDDISQQLPGKNDTKIIRNPDQTKTYLQKRVMILTLSEAYEEFKKIHSSANVGRTKFCSLKPVHVDFVNQLKHVGCLCKMCENMKLLFSSLQSKMNESFESLDSMIGMFSCPDKYCDAVTCDICVEHYSNMIPELFDEAELTDEIILSQWIQDVYQLKLKNEVKELTDCIKIFVERCVNYKQHIFVKASQSSLFFDSRATSNDQNIVMQIDFAENFKCIAQNEVQSAYYNQHTIAIFTVVIWAGRQTFSKVYVTDDTSHSKYCVLVFLNEIISCMKMQLPDLKSIKIFSDGCAAQFKNRWILSLMSTGQYLFDVNLSWNFFASGHGKGAVDGIGGTVKRAVHQRIMSGNVRVYSAAEFSSCVNNSVNGITSYHVTVEEIENLERYLAPLWKNVKAIPGLTKYFSYKHHSDKAIEAKVVGSSATGKIFKVLS